jgi:hypothetical protein
VTTNFAKAQHAVTISLFNESTTISFSTLLNTPVHPGVQVGTEFDWKQGKHFRLYPALNFGYMFHKNLFQAFYIDTELGVDYKTSFGHGPAYLHSGDAIGYFASMVHFPIQNTTITWAVNGNYGKIDDHTQSKEAMDKIFHTVLQW